MEAPVRIETVVASLVALEDEMIEAYDAAIARVADKETEARLRFFTSDHRFVQAELQRFQEQYGEIAALAARSTPAWTTNGTGSTRNAQDRDGFGALLEREQAYVQAYAGALDHRNCLPVAQTFKTALADARRRIDWLRAKCSDRSARVRTTAHS